MINVRLTRDKEGFIWQFEVRGHARYRRAGNDIICAAASVTAYTAVGALEDVAGIKPSWKEEHGYMLCSIPEDITDEQKEKAKIILDTTAIGFKQIELQHKKYLSVLDEEV